MKVETYYCDLCKKEVGKNSNSLNALAFETPLFYGHRNRHYEVCGECIKKIEKLLDDIQQGEK